MKLQTKNIAICVLSITSIVLTAWVNDRGDEALGESAMVQTHVASIIQRHMEGDMMHDAVRYAVTDAILSAKSGLPTSTKEFEEDFTRFSNALTNNLAENLPADIRSDIQHLKTLGDEYGESARAIITLNNPEKMEARMPAFRKLFDQMATEQEQISEKVLEWSANLGKNLRVAAHESEIQMIVFQGFNLMLSLILPIFAIFAVFRPQSQMIEAMNRIVQGDTTTPIPHIKRNDEIGEMARTVQVFKDNALQIQRLAAEQEQQKKIGEEQRRAALNDMANSFESNVKGVVDMVASAATEMDATSRSVGQITGKNQEKLTSLNVEIQGTMRNMQMVAGATSELSSAINEISSQVSRANTVAASAVQEAQRADGTVQSLTLAAQHIGEVLEMINSIAAQINLLALNATIEAARAGDAGKGFAVVASEVKNLANQTTKATEQISEYISSIQSATSETVEAIKHIGGTIHEISGITTTIAAAVEEQGVATRDIANNVQQAAKGTETVSRDADAVSASSEETGVAAHEMVEATSELSRQAETLRREVDKFLVGVRNG